MGARELAAGANELRTGAEQLLNSSSELESGYSEIAGGLKTIIDQYRMLENQLAGLPARSMPSMPGWSRRCQDIRNLAKIAIFSWPWPPFPN